MSTNGCGCGCKEPTQPVTCCELDCLEAPRFFCGQLLTDALLEDLKEWTRARIALARYRDGWGVVCGLDMCCDEASPGGIVIRPGYALSCCGDDIVLCEDAQLDLSSACDEGPDPCEELEPQDWRRAVDRPRSPGSVEGSPETNGTDNGPSTSEPRAVDVYIAYREEQSDPQAALARSACGETGRCEYAHTRETYSLSWGPGGSGDPLTYAALRWRERYDEALEVIDAFKAAFQTLEGGQGDVVRSWLLRWINAHHPHHFCFLRDRICDAEEDALTDESRLTELLFWIAQDRRNQVLTCQCHGCGPASGRVPLGRVWVVPGRNGGCRIAGIDPFPPYRRPLSVECWPAGPGYVNVGQVIWHHRAEACVRLADLGVRVKEVAEFEPPPTLAELRSALACDPLVPCGEERTLLAYKVEPLGERVVGLCAPVTTPTPTNPPAVSVTKTSDPTSGRRGSSVTYTFEVTNTGDEAFEAHVEDDRLGEIVTEEIDPGVTGTYTRETRVPQDATDPFVNTVTVTATGPGGTTTEDATHSFTIELPTPQPSLDIELGAPASIPVGGVRRGVPYTLEIINDGDLDLGVTLTDSLGALPEDQRDFQVAAGDRLAFRFAYQPLRGETRVEETVTGVGTTADGAQVQDEDTAVTTISGDTPTDPTEPKLRDIVGIGETRERLLNEAGIDSLEALIDADPGRIAEIVGPPTTEEHVLRWQEQARQLLER
jgi:predicted flap endonuclease-1-like 5' DNA nuclease